MPVKTSPEAISGATAVFHLEGLCQAEVLTVNLASGSILQVPCNVSIFSLLFPFKCQGQIQSLVGTCHHFTRKTLALLVTGDIRAIQWSQQHQVRTASEFSLRFIPKACCRSCSYCPFILTLDYATWQSGRSPMSTAANASTVNKCTTGSLPRPPVHTIHGRTDWSAKYGHH